MYRLFTALRVLYTVLFLLLLTACASVPPSLKPLADTPDVSGIHAFLRSHHAEDARFQTVHDRPFLKVDLPLRYRLREFPKDESTLARKAFIREVLSAATALGEREVELAAKWVSEEELAVFNAKHHVAPAASAYDALMAAYRRDSHAHLNEEVTAVENLPDSEAINTYWQALNTSLEKSVMTQGRLARTLLNAPAVPFIKGWIAYHNSHDYRGPLTPAFDDYRIYEIDESLIRPHDISDDEWALLQRFAPRIVQERGDHANYPAHYDRFGEISLTGDTLDAALPHANPDRPTVYAYVTHKLIQNSDVRQLNYVIWYPQHPEMSPLDPEAGALDGWTVRISLDVNDRPLVVESMSNCGCYYKIFPSDTLEKASQQVFTEKLKDKNLYLEAHVEKGVDAVVPEVITGLDRAPNGITVYMSAGHHQLISIRAHATNDTETDKPRQSYSLAAYDELEQLPFHDHRASMFATDGLVRHAHRKECTLLSPSGVYHAGHPRQRETQMIYFDEADFDDPHLLEHYLRLPPRAFEGGV